MFSIDDFIELVRRMRAAQTAYFKTRDFETLKEARSLEIKVDKCVEAATNQHLDLFSQQEVA